MAGREDKIMIRINGEIKEKFQSLCDEYGMTMSGMSAYLIGAWVRQQEQITNPMIESIKNVMTETAKKALEGEVEMARNIIGMQTGPFRDKP
jgi:antitoxin component of RelBE/YafQ-DinJ toxin-antitoxin module